MESGKPESRQEEGSKILNWGEMAGDCPRCNGTMIEQKFYEPGEPFWGWRCVFCGEILDSLIWENRNLTRGLQVAHRVGRRNGRERRRVTNVRIPEIGEILRYRETGNIFEVRKITSEFLILHSKDGGQQVMVEKKNLFNSFEKIPPLEPKEFLR